MESRNYILGIFPNKNSSACLLKNGEIIAVGEEERFNRIKTTSSLPIQSIRYVLKEASISFKEVDHIAIAWDCLKYPNHMDNFRSRELKGRTELDELIDQIKTTNWNPNYLEFQLQTQIGETLPPIHYIPHHRSHAASTYYLSGFDESLILTIDGSGEEHATIIWYGSGTNIEKVKEINLPNSLGWFYSAITEFLGFKAYTGEGKVMGLAPYGNDVKEIKEKLRKIIQIKEDSYTIDPSYIYFDKRTKSNKFTDKLTDLLGTPRNHGEDFTQYHKDIAFCVQDLLEEAVENLVRWGIKQTGLKNICIAGGVGMNCKMNGKIRSMKEVDDVFVIPPSSDNGASIGSALQLYKDLGFNPKQYKMQHAYYGPSFSNEEIKHVLDYCKVNYTYHKDIEKVTAEKIYKNKIIGWFQGRMEIGSRALGNRSILGNPLNEDMKDIINSQVKHRESYRPFCPSMLQEDANKYLKNIESAPFMIVAYDAKDGIKEKLPAVVHEDNSVRPQTVCKEDNKRYWNLINEFKSLSGESVILNTSFNIAGEPVVCTPQDAVRCFYGTGIDVLVIGNYLIEK